MKKIFLICCMMAATNMLVLGQTAQASKKSEFTAKVNQLTTLLEQNNADGAKAVWEDVQKMMDSEFAAIKHRIADPNTSSEDRKHWGDVMHKQYAIYRSIASVRGDMVKNQATVKTKLNEFAGNI